LFVRDNERGKNEFSSGRARDVDCSDPECIQGLVRAAERVPAQEGVAESEEWYEAFYFLLQFEGFRKSFLVEIELDILYFQ
jgi:hypothetical protein